MGIIYTAPYRYGGSDRVDITRSGNKKLLEAGHEAPGLILAPSDGILWPAKKALEQAPNRAAALLVFAGYAAKYHDEMRRSFVANREGWYQLAYRHEITLVCFCEDPELCHRSLAAQYLAKISNGYMEVAGERQMKRAGAKRGCVRVDLGNGASATVCGMRRAASCDSPGCRDPHTALCDYQVVRNGKKATCNQKMCERHRNPVPDKHDTDYCGAHHRLAQREPKQEGFRL